MMKLADTNRSTAWFRARIRKILQKRAKRESKRKRASKRRQAIKYSRSTFHCAVLKARKARKGNTRSISGDDGKRVPPVPIPNTEVKPLSAEGTWLVTAREIRTPPDSKAEVEWLLFFYFEMSLL